MPCFSSKVFRTWLHFRNATKSEKNCLNRSRWVWKSSKSTSLHTTSQSRVHLKAWASGGLGWDFWPLDQIPLMRTSSSRALLTENGLPGDMQADGARPHLLHVDQARTRNLRADLSWAAFAWEVPWALIVLVKTENATESSTLCPGCV